MGATLIRLALLVSMGALAYNSGKNLAPATWYYPNFWWVPLLTGGITMLILYGLNSRMNDPKSYVRFFMGATAGKLFLYTLLITVVAVLAPAEATGVALCFLFFYLITTGFETATAFSSVTGKSR
jgi:hypothetical protein